MTEKSNEIVSRETFSLIKETYRLGKFHPQLNVPTLKMVMPRNN